MKRGDRVTVREVPGRWWVAGERTDLLALAPDDADAALYQMTSVHERASCMLRWPDDVSPAAGSRCPTCGTWREAGQCDRCGHDELPLDLSPETGFRSERRGGLMPSNSRSRAMYGASPSFTS